MFNRKKLLTYDRNWSPIWLVSGTALEIPRNYWINDVRGTLKET